MRRELLLLVALFLVMKLRLCQSRCEPSRRSSSEESPGFGELRRSLLKRYGDVDYDSFVGLMGRRSADTNAIPPPQKREMQDIFVGLMGRRDSEPAVTGDTAGSWRKDYPEAKGLFYNKCKLRFRRGL